MKPAKVTTNCDVHHSEALLDCLAVRYVLESDGISRAYVFWNLYGIFLAGGEEQEV